MTLWIVSAATALLLLDVTVVNVAIPAISEDLGADLDEAQWVIDAYALALASTLLALGSLADRRGRRRAVHGRFGGLRAGALRLCGAAARRLPGGRLGIAIGIAVLGGLLSAEAPYLDPIFLCGGLVALLSAPVAWRLLGDLRNS